MAWLLRFDGLYEPRYTDRGLATYGYVVERDGAQLHEGKGLLLGPGEGGNANVAEFGAMIHGLTWIAERKTDETPLVVEGDSRLAIETVAGRWNLTSERLLPLRDWAQALLARIPGPKTFRKIGREANARPDALTREAYHEAADANPEWGLGIHKRSARPPPRL